LGSSSPPPTESGAPAGSIPLLLVTLLSYPAGLLIGVPWLLPILNTAYAYGLMVRLLRQGRRGEAVQAMLVWAAALAVFGTVAFALWPTDPGPLVLNGPAYRDEMFHWIRTGEGSEGSPRSFLPQHVGHLAAFVVLCLVSGSALSMPLGAVLMNYMDYYVASLARAGVPVAATALFGWQPWAICRVAAFVALGAVLAEPALRRLAPGSYGGLGSARRAIAWAAAGILADWLLKALLAPYWRAVLAPLLG
jgi:hypothetical protein